MFKKLLTVLTVCAATTPAFADTYSVVRNAPLTRTIEQAGTVVKLWDPICSERGSFGAYYPKKNTLVVCVSNHRDNGVMDYAELGDTLRHEAIHVAQTCYGNGTPKPILSWTQIAKYSNNRILSIVQRYKPEHQHLEYEAFTSAAVMTNEQITKIVRDFCF